MAEIPKGALIDGGGDGTEVTDATVDTQTQMNLDEETAALLAIVLALKSLDPNLQKAYDEYMKPTKNMALVISLVKASKFYQNYNKTARARALSEKEQPGVWAQELEKYKTEQKKRIIGLLGPSAWTPEVQKQVEIAFNFALDDDVLDKLIIATKSLGKVGGAIMATADELQTYANSYGVGKLFDANYWKEQEQKIFLGEITSADIQADIRDKAAQAYPAFADGFSNGKSLDTQAGWILNLVANNLGLNPNSLSFDDPAVSPFLNFIDPKSGKQVVPPVNIVQTETRRKYFDQFAKTPTGTAYIDGLTVRALQDMGLM